MKPKTNLYLIAFGFIIVILGAGLNFFVILQNKGMPIKFGGFYGRLGNYIFFTDYSQVNYGYLGDIINVIDFFMFSIGDLIIIFGLFVFCINFWKLSRKLDLGMIFEIRRSSESRWKA